MQIRFLANAFLGISVEILYAVCVMLAAFLFCILFAY
jgi:hypothetical protein